MIYVNKLIKVFIFLDIVNTFAMIYVYQICIYAKSGTILIGVITNIEERSWKKNEE